jgi:hypothetical protein
MKMTNYARKMTKDAGIYMKKSFCAMVDDVRKK